MSDEQAYFIFKGFILLLLGVGIHLHLHDWVGTFCAVIFFLALASSDSHKKHTGEPK